MKLNKEILLNNGYKQFRHPYRDNDKNEFYQKRVNDKNENEMYYINCTRWSVGTMYEGYEFSTVLYPKGLDAIEVTTLQWFNVISENNPRTLDDVENLCKDLYYHLCR